MGVFVTEDDLTVKWLPVMMRYVAGKLVGKITFFFGKITFYSA